MNSYKTISQAAEELAHVGITRNNLVHLHKSREKLGCANVFSSVATRGWVRVNMAALKAFLREKHGMAI